VKGGERTERVEYRVAWTDGWDGGERHSGRDDPPRQTDLDQAKEELGYMPRLNRDAVNARVQTRTVTETPWTDLPQQETEQP
jgi:hypothetical protein